MRVIKAIAYVRCRAWYLMGHLVSVPLGYYEWCWWLFPIYSWMMIRSAHIDRKYSTGLWLELNSDT